MKDIIERLGQHQTQKRIDEWKTRLNNDGAANRRGVMQGTPMFWGSGEGDPHPQLLAERSRAELAVRWRHTEAVHQGRAQGCLRDDCSDLAKKVKDWANSRRSAGVSIAVTADGLRRRAMAAKGKAPAPNRLQAGPLTPLPVDSWEALQILWTTVLRLGRFPRQWLEVWTVSIPKKEGGDRPLSVEALFWRLGMALITSQLGDWMNGWTPRNIAGAVRHRSAEPLHDRFLQDIITKSKEGIAGAKMDLAKAFDMVRTDDATFLLAELGAPPEVLRLLEDSDLRHRK